MSVNKIKVLLIMLSMLLFVSGCGYNKKDDSIKIVCTSFSAYDWTCNIIGEEHDNIELIYLLDDGVDMHSFQPTVEDIANVSSCDIFICVGGESEFWVEDALKEKVNKDMVIVNLIEILGENARLEEHVEGMQLENEGEHEEHEEEIDEHVWLSVKNAVLFVEAIKDTICEADSGNKEKYENNCTSYVERLIELNNRFEAAKAEFSKDTIMLADRFPFVYLLGDYDIKYVAAFSGCSADTEASFETITYLAEKLDSLDLDYVFVLENSKEDLAQTIINTSDKKNQQILVLDSLQSVSAQDIKSGKSYLDTMTDNLDYINQSLR